MIKDEKQQTLFMLNITWSNEWNAIANGKLVHVYKISNSHDTNKTKRKKRRAKELSMVLSQFFFCSFFVFFTFSKLSFLNLWLAIFWLFTIFMNGQMPDGFNTKIKQFQWFDV